MKQTIVSAQIENGLTVTSFVDEYLEEKGCPIKAMMQIDVAIDEIFSNIVYYAYKEVTDSTISKEVTVIIDDLADKDGVSITFIDNGKKYNPLEKEDPDVTLVAEERGIGGLGIFIVKKTMDEVLYKYENSQNKLKIIKYF